MLTEYPLKILVVEDDFMGNKLICRQLETAGHQVVGKAYNGKQAIEMTKRLSPNIVLMDMQMKNPDTGDIDIQAGVKAARIIQEQCPTPVIIISAHEDPSLIREANTAGVGAYLIKPSSLDEIERSIAVAIARFNDLMEVHRLNKELKKEIARRVKSEKVIKFMATHDPLTSLPNRWLFNDRMKQEIAHAKRNQQKLGVIFLDLDFFKKVNDTLGHKAGDQLLKMIGQRLSKLMRKSDTVARIGGDEFILLLPEMTQTLDATETAQRILKAVHEPLTFNDQTLQITTSIGIAIYPDDGEQITTLMRNADSAMYYVKEHGRNNYQYYSADAK
ncbi:MAG: diguanylate cyclase [Chloroflexota bacterium]|nr:diguanylate cyclase [Chloroflexota bacterium]